MHIPIPKKFCKLLAVTGGLLLCIAAVIALMLGICWVSLPWDAARLAGAGAIGTGAFCLLTVLRMLPLL